MADHHPDHPDHEGHAHLPPDPALRVKALESLLVAKGLVDRDTLDMIVERYADEVGPMRGARMVAKAWTDPDYRARLLEDGGAAARELGYSGRQGEHLRAVENTAEVHNLVVCTLCSCYPLPVLGLPPRWYKSDAYRSRAVIDPRGVLGDFGLTLAEHVELRVWDSTSEVRYLVVPARPSGSEGLDEDELATLVSRDSMIGTAFATSPSSARSLSGSPSGSNAGSVGASAAGRAPA